MDVESPALRCAMLQQTFLHISGVGETTEHKIWDLGIHSWMDFMEAHQAGKLAGRRIEHSFDEVAESIRRHELGDWNYFDQRLPGPHKWRVFGELEHDVIYLDIETTGRNNEITVIGTYNGTEAKSFVAGINLEDALEEIERHSLVVTFNGTFFDMPVIRSHFHYNLFNHIHIDLRFPLKRLGWTGGLKKIEEAMGIERSERTKGLDGWDAVKLWASYQRGRDAALELLLEYNLEDIKNLQPLMRYVFQEMKKTIPAMA